MLVIAHRGNSSVAPQNTLAAFEAACRAGTDAVELDVRQTRDGELVVIHDRDVAATTDGSGKVKNLDLGQVRSFDAGSRFSPAFAGQRIPLLTEALELVAGARNVGAFVELKGVWSADEARRVTDAVDAAGLGGPTLVQSFRRHTVAALQAAAPHLPRALLVDVWTPDLAHACRSLGAVACNPAKRILRRHPRLAAELRAAGLEVYPWTFDDPEDWLALEGTIDGLITNRPDRLRGWLDARALAGPDSAS
jgi:glycerophosphoryl diester phosphodiesterase